MSEKKSEEKPKDGETKEKKEGNPLLGMVDKVLEGARKFLAEQKMLKLADELTYLALRKSVDFLSSTFIPMKIDGLEHVPEFKPAILCSIVEQPIELFLATKLTPRKIHFMVPVKMFETPGLKPLLDAIGAFRSTTSQDDMEPIQKTIEFLNQDKDLVAMIPLDNGERERLDKSISGVLKFAAGIPCPVIIYAATPLKGFKLGKSIHFKVAEPISVKPNIKREERHELAAKIVDQILAMKKEIAEAKDEEQSSAKKKA
ncbi:MAG: lysophospholipid acyltransferase family protein [Candidatus Sigynarchaeota archaeon]